MSVAIFEILFLSHEAMFIFFKALLEINAFCCGFVIHVYIYFFFFFFFGHNSYSSILIKQGDETDVEITTSDTRSKQPQPTTGSSTQSQSARSQSHLEKTSDHAEQITEIGKQFPDVPSSKGPPLPTLH